MRMFRRVVIVGLSTVSSLAFAGAQAQAPVTVDANARTASGSLGTTRNFGGWIEMLGCSSTAVAGGGSYANCTAQDAAGTYVMCWSYDPEIVQAARSMNGDSFIAFGWEKNGECSYLAVENFSHIEPKK